jgi:hypothetical protein
VLAGLPATGAAEDVQAGDAGALTLVRADDQLTALDATGATAWAVPALGLPTSGGSGKDAREATELLVPEDGAFVRRDTVTGVELGRSAIDDDVPDRGIATTVGPVVVLRLPDRILTYR